MGTCPHYEFRQKSGRYFPPEHYCRYMKQTIPDRQLDCCFNYYERCTEYKQSCYRKPNNNNNSGSRSSGGIFWVIVIVVIVLAKIWGFW